MKKWIIAASYSGHELRVKADIEKKLGATGKSEFLSQILIPEETYTDVKKDGTKVEKTKVIFPGYIFIELVLLPDGKVDEDVWYYIRNTQNVTGILGSGGGGEGPSFVVDQEMQAVLKMAGLISDDVKHYKFNEGDKIEVISGPWEGNISTISEINQEQSIAKVFIEVFGRQTPLDISFDDMKKIDE